MSYLHATVVDDAIRFVLSSQKSKDKGNAKSSSGNDKEKSKEEPDYGEDKDQLEEKQLYTKLLQTDLEKI